MAASTLKLKTLPAVTVATSGTRQPIYGSPIYAYSVLIQSLPSNEGVQYIGDSTVTVGTGIEIAPGDATEMEAPERSRTDQFDLSMIYVDSDTNGAEFRIIAWIRE
jgi:hypothetical protein